MYYQKIMESENKAFRFQFLVRLSNLPVVHSALDQATYTYGRVKQINGLLGSTLSKVEINVQFAIRKAEPIVRTLEMPITSADILACKGLDKIEETIPIIKEPTEKILQDTKDRYMDTVQRGIDRYNSMLSYGSSKLSAVKKFGSDKATQILNSEYGKFVTRSLDEGISSTEDLLEYYLPAQEDEEKLDYKQKPVLERISYLSSTVYHRTRKLALIKMQELQEAAQVTVANNDLITACTLKYMTVQNYLDGRFQILYGSLNSLKSMPENMYTNAVWVIGELNKAPDSLPEGSQPTLQQQAWNASRHITRSIVNTYSGTAMIVHRLQSRVQTTLSSVYVHTVQVIQRVRNDPLEKLQPVAKWLVHVCRTQLSSQSSLEEL